MENGKVVYNYSIAYVLVDGTSLHYYNRMMKSILSIRIHMPDIQIYVIMDNYTMDVLMVQGAKLSEYASIVPVEVPEGYNQVERSRYLKLNVRKILSGDFLFVDTDTVICREFPETISEKSFAAVFDGNVRFDELQTPHSYMVNSAVNIDIKNITYYVNSGVMWAKDDDIAHQIYSRWYEMWEETRKPEMLYDQPTLNYVLRDYFISEGFEFLGNEWNVQLAHECHAGIEYLHSAYILHYFGVSDCAFLFCQRDIYNLSYDDDRIGEMIRNPLRAFGLGRLYGPKEIKRREYQQKIAKTNSYQLLCRLYGKKWIFQIVEGIAGLILRIRIRF